MSNKSKERKENRYKEKEEIKQIEKNPSKEKEYAQANALDGGNADNLTIEDLAEMHGVDLDKMKIQLKMGIKVEYEHTRDKSISTEIAMDHLYEIPDYYTRLSKMEGEAKKEGELSEPEDKKEGDVDEMMGAGGSGQFSAPMGQPIKREIYKPETMSESAPESSGQYDLPAFNSKKGPLGIDGEKSIKQRAKTIEKRKSLPKFGGPDAVFVKIKDKCKKFPYCNQSPEAIEIVKEDAEIRAAIMEVSKKRGIPYEDLENLVINEIKAVFI